MRSKQGTPRSQSSHTTMLRTVQGMPGRRWLREALGMGVVDQSNYNQGAYRGSSIQSDPTVGRVERLLGGISSVTPSLGSSTVLRNRSLSNKTAGGNMGGEQGQYTTSGLDSLGDKESQARVSSLASTATRAYVETKILVNVELLVQVEALYTEMLHLLKERFFGPLFNKCTDWWDATAQLVYTDYDVLPCSTHRDCTGQ